LERGEGKLKVHAADNIGRPGLEKIRDMGKEKER
jgi:hypothetical protein